MKCIICKEKLAQVPDRNRMGRPIKRLCKDCHRDRLRGDLQRIISKRAQPIDIHSE